MKTKDMEPKRTGNELTELSRRLDRMDNKQMKRMRRKGGRGEGRVSGLHLAVVIAVVLILPSLTPFGPLFTIAILLLIWPLTLPATIAIIVLARKRRYGIAIGVVLATVLISMFILSL